MTDEKYLPHNLCGLDENVVFYDILYECVGLFTLLYGNKMFLYIGLIKKLSFEELGKIKEIEKIIRLLYVGTHKRCV